MSWFFILLTALLVNLGGQANASYNAEIEARPDQIPINCWYCIPCNRMFYDLGSLNKHVKRHHHISKKHSGVVKKYSAPVYACYKCRYAFASYRLLAEHNRTCHPKNVKKHHIQIK